jgi:hypothetical protein
MPVDNSPVNWHYLEDLRNQLGLLVFEFCTLFGISMVKWSDMKRNPGAPVPDAAIALLARIIRDDPSLSWIPVFPTPKDVFDKLERICATRGQNVSHRQFSIANGRDSSTTNRWIAYGHPPGPFATRLIHTLQKTLTNKGYEGWMEWQDHVDAEAQARGIPDIWMTGAWRNGAHRQRDSNRISIDDDENGSETEADGADK